MKDPRIVKLKTNPSPGYVYLISAVGTGIFKIGKTQVSVLTRLKGLQTGSPIVLRYVYHVYVENVDICEVELHRRFSDRRQIGEWFALTPTEVKECILLMRLVKETEPIEVFVSSEAEEKTEENTEVEIETEGEGEARFCSLGFTRIEAVNQIDLLRERLNKQQIIELLWNCKKGRSADYQRAYAEFHELTAGNATTTNSSTEGRFGSERLTKIETIGLIERLQKTLNQSQIIETLWNCTVGGSRAYKQAHAEFQELTAKNATIKNILAE